MSSAFRVPTTEEDRHDRRRARALLRRFQGWRRLSPRDGPHLERDRQHLVHAAHLQYERDPFQRRLRGADRVRAAADEQLPDALPRHRPERGGHQPAHRGQPRLGQGQAPRPRVRRRHHLRRVGGAGSTDVEITPRPGHRPGPDERLQAGWQCRHRIRTDGPGAFPPDRAGASVSQHPLRMRYIIRMRRGRLAPALIGLATLLAACGTSTPSTTTGSTIIFGAAVSLTGTQSFEGKLTKQGYDLWLDWIKARGGIVIGNVKHPVDIKYEDDQSKADISATLVQKLITDEKANFILGPYGSSATATDAIVVERNGIPMVEANGAAQAIFSHGYKFTFGVLSPANKYLTGVLDMAATLSPKPTTIAMLAANDNFSLEVAKAIADYAPTKVMQIVFTKQYPAAAPDVSSLISQAKQTNPDIVLNSGHLAEAIAINKSAKQLGLNAKIFAYSVGPSTPDFISALGSDANYVYDGSQWTPQVKYTPTFYLSVADYVKAYQAKYGGSDAPDYHVAESTAACLAFQKAIENAGSLDPSKVRDALASLDVMTFFGQIKFDSRGINIYKPMVVEQIQNGTHYTVFPPSVANGQPQYPTPSWSSR